MKSFFLCFSFFLFSTTSAPRSDDIGGHVSWNLRTFLDKRKRYMGKVIAFTAIPLSYDDTVDEIEVLIPKYIESVKDLEEVSTIREIPALLINVGKYWDRLLSLFEELKDVDVEVDVDETITNSLAKELKVLENVYLKVNNFIVFHEQEWSTMMWQVAENLLDRMDFNLKSLGFDAQHEDRQLLQEMKANNALKRQRWSLESQEVS